jgi:hypothetical protein
MKAIKWLDIIALFLAGCTSSRITSSWKDENVSPRQYNKILVLGLIREADRTIRENMEDHLVGDLQNLGYNAVSALEEYGPKAFDKMDEEAALAKLNNSGVDAVVTIVLLDKGKEKRYVPGHINYSPYGYYYNRFWGYYGTMNRRIYEPGYYVTDTKYFWESNFYDMRTQKLLYSVQTQSFDPASSESLGHQYGLLILKHMIKNGVVAKKNIISKPF